MVTPINRYQIPTPAERTATLAEATGYRSPSKEAREMAGDLPVSEEEHAALNRLYARVHKTEVRQAILDTLCAVCENQEV